MTSFKLKFGTNQKTMNGRLLVVEDLRLLFPAVTRQTCPYKSPLQQVSQEFKLRQLHQWSNFQKHQSTWATQANPQKMENSDRFW